MALEARPKESKGVLEPTPNTFAVENGLVYDYYPVKFGARTGDFVAIQKLPPTMQEGYVTYQRKLYKVELRDFVRSRFNVGKPAYTVPGVEPITTSAVSPDSVQPTSAVDNSSQLSEQQRAESTFGVQVNEAADVAWEDQIRTLLYLDDPEEEWQLETSAQS